MTDIAILVENLSKRYHIGGQHSHSGMTGTYACRS